MRVGSTDVAHLGGQNNPDARWLRLQGHFKEAQGTPQVSRPEASELSGFPNVCASDGPESRPGEIHPESALSQAPLLTTPASDGTLTC